MQSYQTKSHLDVQYSPSKWCTRMCSCLVIEDHISFTAKKSEEARQTIPSKIDIAFSDSPIEKLDLIGTDLPDDAPICVFIHGGFWSALSKKQSAYPALFLHKLGIKTFVIEYALCPTVTLRTITEQIQRAFDFTLDYATSMKSRSISLMGHSAGAHLLAYLLTTYTSRTTKLSLIQEVFLIAGLYDLHPLLNSYANDKTKLTEQEALSLSVINKPLSILQNYPNIKLYFFISENDSPAFHEQSQLFFRKLQSSNLKNLKMEYVTIFGRDHFDLMHSLVEDTCFESSQNLSRVDNLSEALLKIFEKQL